MSPRNDTLAQLGEGKRTVQVSQNQDERKPGAAFAKQLIQKLRQSSFARGAAGNFGVRVVGAGFGFLSQIILARVLQASGYGIYIYALTWINLVAIGGAVGFTTASVRFVSEYGESRSATACHEFERSFVAANVTDTIFSWRLIQVFLLSTSVVV
mgnify:CR=1 FL=1